MDTNIRWIVNIPFTKRRHPDGFIMQWAIALLVVGGIEFWPNHVVGYWHAIR